MIYGDIESILVSEDNGKQNPEESYTSKYQKYVACNYGHNLVCVDDKFSKSFKSSLQFTASHTNISVFNIYFSKLYLHLLALFLINHYVSSKKKFASY